GASLAAPVTRGADPPVHEISRRACAAEASRPHAPVPGQQTPPGSNPEAREEAEACASERGKLFPCCRRGQAVQKGADLAYRSQIKVSKGRSYSGRRALFGSSCQISMKVDPQRCSSSENLTVRLAGAP